MLACAVPFLRPARLAVDPLVQARAQSASVGRFCAVAVTIARHSTRIHNNTYIEVNTTPRYPTPIVSPRLKWNATTILRSKWISTREWVNLVRHRLPQGPFLWRNFCEEIGHIVRSTKKRSRREWGYGETSTSLSRVVRFSTGPEVRTRKQTLESISTAC